MDVGECTQLRMCPGAGPTASAALRTGSLFWGTGQKLPHGWAPALLTVEQKHLSTASPTAPTHAPSAPSAHRPLCPAPTATLLIHTPSLSLLSCRPSSFSHTVPFLGHAFSSACGAISSSLFSNSCFQSLPLNPTPHPLLGGAISPFFSPDSSE